MPRNIGELKELDGFMRDLLYDARKNFTLDSDKKLRKIQSKVYEIMGPLESLWKKISKAKKKGGTAVSGGDIIRTLDQSVILLGQVNNSLNFLRRITGLTAIGIERPKASTMLKDNVTVFRPKASKLYEKRFYKLR